MPRRNLGPAPSFSGLANTLIFLTKPECSICSLLAPVVEQWALDAGKGFARKNIDLNDPLQKDLLYKVPVLLWDGRIVAHSLSDLDIIKANLNAAWTNL